MQGFFDLGFSTAPVKKAPKEKTCTECPSCTGSSPQFSVRGNLNSKILIVAEFPSKEDVSRDRALSSNAYSMLWELEKEIGINLEKEAAIIYAAQCRPQLSKDLSKSIQICRTKLLQTVKAMKPNVIITLGEQAIEGLIWHRITGRLSGLKKDEFFGFTIPDQELNAWVCPTYSFEEIHREEKQSRQEIRTELLREHLINAFNLVHVPLRRPYPDVEWTMDQKTALEWIEKAKEHKGVVAFDYETTAILPYREEQELKTISFAFNGKGYAMPYFKTKTFENAVNNLLIYAKTAAHNASFETLWTKHKGGNNKTIRVHWDTCLAAHCLNSQSPVSLKFQTYVHLGVLGFDSQVDEFITKARSGEEDKGGHSINRIDQCPMSVLLKYNAYDSLCTHQLQQIQEKLLTKTQMKGFMFFMEVLQTLIDMTDKGMKIDLKKLEENEEELTSIINAMKKEIYAMDDVKRHGTLDINSNTQLEEFIYDFLKFKPSHLGRKVDEKALTQYDHPVIQALLRYKKAIKLRDTYLAQFKREQHNGIIHPSFNLHTVMTFRSSSSNPNFQNVPIRSEEGSKYIRGLAVPEQGCHIVEYDYKALEVAIGTTYHKDPNMIKYLWSETADFHADTGMDLFLRTKEDLKKRERQTAKNKFVFPSFYGSTARVLSGQTIGTITRDLWQDIDQDTKLHLFDNGIKEIRDFQNHVEKVEKKLWEERFPIYNEWRNKEWKDYKRKGFLTTYTGFTIGGELSFTQAINARTQGTASHVLLYTMHSSAEEMKRRGIDLSYFIAQIHDSILGNIHPKDMEEVDAIIKYNGTQRVLERFPELAIIPLIIEKDMAGINESWHMKKSIGKI